MSPLTMRRAHKWIAVTVSAVLLGWLTSGILMTLPKKWLAGAPPPRASAALGGQRDFRDVRVSIPQALAALEAKLEERLDVADVKVTRFDTTLAYDIGLREKGRHLVDAFTGEPIVITQAMAETRARTVSPHAAGPTTTTLLTHRDFYYWGTLPVYKVAFDDAWGTVVYVSAVTGETEPWDRLRRVRRWIISLHGFEPLRLLASSETLRAGLLILFALVGLATVCTGLYLALPPGLWPARPPVAPDLVAASGPGAPRDIDSSHSLAKRDVQS